MMPLTKSREQTGAWAMLGVLLLIYVCAYLDRASIALVVDPIRVSLGLDDVQIGLLVGLAFSAAYAIGGVPIGWLVDNAPRRWVLVGGVALWGLATTGAGLVATFEGFFIARMLIGFGEASLAPAAHSLIADTFPRHRLSLALSTYSLGATIGSGVALIAGGTFVQVMTERGGLVLPIIGHLEPWRAAFVCLGLPSIGVGFLILLFREPVRRARGAAAFGAKKLQGMIAFLRENWKIWLTFTLAFGGMNICNSALIFWQPAYMARQFGWKPAEYGLALGLTIAVAGGAGLLFSGWLVDRLYARGVKDAPLRYYLWALVFSTPFVLVALLAQNVWWYLGLIWIAKFATVNFLGFGSAAVQLTSPPHLRGRMSALFVTLIVSLIGNSVGATLPPVIAVGVFGDQAELGKAIALLLAVCVPVAIAALWFGLRPFREAVTAMAEITVEAPASATSADSPG